MNTNKKYNPITCGSSTKIHNDDIYICKLECIPCALHFNNECYYKKMDNSIEVLMNYINGGNNDDEQRRNA